METHFLFEGDVRVTDSSRKSALPASQGSQEPGASAGCHPLKATVSPPPRQWRLFLATPGPLRNLHPLPETATKRQACHAGCQHAEEGESTQAEGPQEPAQRRPPQGAA